MHFYKRGDGAVVLGDNSNNNNKINILKLDEILLNHFSTTCNHAAEGEFHFLARGTISGRETPRNSTTNHKVVVKNKGRQCSVS